MKQTCATCKHHKIDIASPGDCVCKNRSSENFTEWTHNDETCDSHEDEYQI